VFTGIIEETGTVRSIARGSRSAEIGIRAKTVLGGTRPGDSVAVNGACLTVTRLEGDGFVAEAMAETLDRTTLKGLVAGNRVNLERALTPASRLGGHLVSGHVDGTGVVESISQDGIALIYRLSCAEEILRYVARKGSVAIDGISLTVCEVGDGYFTISEIPHTAEATTLNDRAAGSPVNIECDMIAKYIERLLFPNRETARVAKPIDESFLRMHGFTEGR
jgi:riboflavin synthase